MQTFIQRLYSNSKALRHCFKELVEEMCLFGLVVQANSLTYSYYLFVVFMLNLFLLCVQGNLQYTATPSVPATDIFGVDANTGDIRIINSQLLKLDRSTFTYRVS